MRILIVEDEPRIAADIAGAVSSLGYVAETVHDGETSWFKGGTESYGAVILDLGLPKLDGVPCSSAARKGEYPVPSDRPAGPNGGRIDAGPTTISPNPSAWNCWRLRSISALQRTCGAGHVGYRSASSAHEVTVSGVPVIDAAEYRLINLLPPRGCIVQKLRNLYDP
jgi:hypothetical protein